jgi:hypothetical protein
MKSKERIEQEIDFLKSKIDEIGQAKTTHQDIMVATLKGYIKMLEWVLES